MTPHPNSDRDSDGIDQVVHRAPLEAAQNLGSSGPLAAAESLLGQDSTGSVVENLSPMALGVLSQLLQGKTEKEIAATLRMNVHTVHSHVKRLYKRLRVRSKAELILTILQRNSTPILNASVVATVRDPESTSAANIDGRRVSRY